jgi:glycosyltransferase involved in cell wall biosynthesis
MADQIWVISSYLRDKYARLSNAPENVHIIPTIIDCRNWRLPPEPDASPLVLLYAGSFTEQDDIEKIAAALSFLRRKNVAFRMRFLGADPQNHRVQSLKLLLNELKIADSVQLFGFQPAETVKQEISNANILINLRTNSLWSRSGLSTKLSEYLAAGRAVLTTNVGDTSRYVKNDESGLVVEPDAPPERIASELKRVIEEPALRRKLAAGARQVALNHFDVPVVQKVLSRVLETLPNRQLQPNQGNSKRSAHPVRR